MENKGSLFFGISSVIIIFLFFLPDLFKQPENGAEFCISVESLTDVSGQEEKVWSMESLCPVQKDNLMIVYKLIKIFVATILLTILFHMSKVLFLQGKGRIFVCFKSCMFYPAHFLFELFILQKSDGKKRVFLS